MLGGIREGIGGISTAGWVGLFAVAGIAAYKLIKYWAIDKPQQDVAEAKQKAEESIAKAKKETDNQSQLKSLVEQYEQIAKSGLRDAQTRTKLLDVQSKINDLVGSQAKGLDLVNGKLSTELEKLKEISKHELERSIPTYEKAYKDASEAAEKVSYENTGWLTEFQKYEKEHNGNQGINMGAEALKDALTDLKDANGEAVDTRILIEKLEDFNYNRGQNTLALAKIIAEEKNLNDKDRTAILDAIDQIENGAGERDVDMHDVVGLLDDYIDMSHEERVQALENAKKYVEEKAKEDGEEYSKLPLWNNITNALTSLDGTDGSNKKATDAANELLKHLTEWQVGGGEEINSVDEYFEYKQKLVNTVMDNELIQKAVKDGALTEEAIDQYINNYLGTFDKYANFYKEWNLKVKRNEIKDTFGTDLYFDTEHDPTKNKKLAEDFSNWVDSLNPNEIDIVYDLQLKTESAKWSLDDWKRELEKAKQDVGEATNVMSEVFSSKESENGDTFSARIKTYRENINSLTEALEKYKNGELDEDTFHGLVEKFPQLAGRTKDLDVAITDLMDDMDTKMVSDFDNQFGKLETQEDINALKEYESQVLSTRETAAKFQSDIENLVSVFGTVKSAVEEYNENGFLSLSSLQSILSLNDKYISALTNEQGALDLSTESYKKLVEAELIELKAQTLQNSLDTVRNIDNRTEALAYLNEREHSAAQASLDLADAQWQEALSAAAVKDIQQGTGDLYQRTVIAARKAYDTRIALIDEYAKTTFTIGELSTATDEYSKALNNEKEALENSKKALEDQKNALEETKQGYEDALSAVKDLVSWVQDYIKQIKNDEIDALEKKKESIDKLIESQKELLDAEQEEYEWNKTIAEKQNTVAKDALAASIASLDDSSAGRKAQKQANDKLAESRTDMQDALYEHEIEQRKEALDKLKEEQDEYYDNLIKEIQDYLGNEVQLYKDACSMIDNDSGDLYGKLLWYCRNYTTTTEAEFNHMWNSAQSAMEQYNAANLGTFELLNNLQGRIYEVDGAIDAITQSISSYESAIDGVQSKLDGLSKQAQRTIADVRAAANAEDEWSKPKWVYTWQGNDYTSFMSNRDAAIQDIIRKIEGQYGGVFPASASTIYGTIRKYASGTNSATGGLSLVGERGAELRVLNSGDGILKNQIVRGLTSLGANPAQFIADAGQMLMKNLFGSGLRPALGTIGNNNQIAPNIIVTVQGDATQSTVNALKAQAQKIMNDTIKMIHSDTLTKTYSSRVR